MSDTRRGIQSVFFLSLQKTFASAICSTLNAAPKGTQVEIEFSAAHDGGQGWANAQAAVNTLSGRGVNLAVGFGHHTMAPDKSAAAWGTSLFNGLFKTYWSKAKFIILVANEDTYSDRDWTGLMTALLGGLRTAWQNDSMTRSLPFPYDRLAVRRCPPRAIPSPFKIAAADKVGVAVETEYHYPDKGSIVWGQAATVVSNDGQIVYRPGKDPNPWAYNGTALLQVSLDDFKRKSGSRLLLWHPALHRWAFKNKAYTSATREDANQANQTAFLSLLADFLK